MRFILRLIIIFISFVLYATFGCLCGVAYKAFSTDCPKVAMKSSPLLKKFIDSNSDKEATFSIDEIQDGIVHIMIKNSSKNARAGDSVVLPSLPILQAEANGISVSIPVYLNTLFGDVGSCVIFEFSVNNKLNFENLRIGSAKVPDFAHLYIAKMVLANYNTAFGDYLDKLADLHVKKLDKEFVLSK
ncbi:MAG: hypothetical protein E7035_01340 [Verrucomicrobiaceae bacterium]|nr:hypothetical protein [Verrucomicrobiaceae bacterium]